VHERDASDKCPREEKIISCIKIKSMREENLIFRISLSQKRRGEVQTQEGKKVGY
jgi:hypothetical protein